MNCQFCGAAAKQIWKDEVIYFECGTRPHHLEPGSTACWYGLVLKLKERIEVLEAKVNRKKPVTLRELSREEGWHPEIKKG